MHSGIFNGAASCIMARYVRRVCGGKAELSV